MFICLCRAIIEKCIGIFFFSRSRLHVDLENQEFEFAIFSKLLPKCIGAKLAFRNGFLGSDVQAYRYPNLSDKSTD